MSFHVAELAQHEGEVVTAFFLVQSKDTRATRDGKSYLALRLSDSTGIAEARAWNPERDIDEFAVGDLVKVEAQVDVYRGKAQLKVRKLRPAREDEADLSDFLPSTQYDVEELYEELLAVAHSVNREPLEALLVGILTDEEIAPRLKRAPAAKVMHHAVLGGLLEHIVSLCRLCRLAAQNYPEVDTDLLLTGAILHDIGKVYELGYERGFDYTTEGRLVGHIQLGLELINRKVDAIEEFPKPLRSLVRHMILSHHGRLEFGSPVTPRFREAVLLHYLDDLDSKMDAMRRELTAADLSGKEGEWTDWNRSLDRPILRQERFLNESVDEVREEAAVPEKTAESSEPSGNSSSRKRKKK